MTSEEAKHTSDGGKYNGKRDYGYFGKGDTGYAQYMTAFNRNFGGSSGGGGGNHNNGGGGGGDGSGCGCLIAIAVVVVLVLIAMGS